MAAGVPSLRDVALLLLLVIAVVIANRRNGLELTAGAMIVRNLRARRFPWDDVVAITEVENHHGASRAVLWLRNGRRLRLAPPGESFRRPGKPPLDPDPAPGSGLG